MVNDDGALEGFTAMLIALLLLMMLTFATGSVLVTQYQRGQAAADLAAIAAVGDPEPCAVASAVAERNGARLLACVPSSSEVELTVAVPTGLAGWELPRSVQVSARAGVPGVEAEPIGSTVTP